MEVWPQSEAEEEALYFQPAACLSMNLTILWLFVTGDSFSVVSDCRGERINEGALCDEPEQMTFLSSPCLFHATRQTHLLRLESGPDTLLGLTQAAPALTEHPVEL